MKLNTPKGTRDFSPQEMVRRNYIFDTIREVYQRYGYMPIETPAMENLETLTGKYGEEGDRLIFRVMPRGAKLQRALEKVENLAKVASEEVNPHIFSSLMQNATEEALRYDLTVPFARYVVQHQNEITFPFKRYQIQPVWRADRPQKGRYREFYQCDADVIGSDSLLNEVELVQIIDKVFDNLGITVIIKINNRKILAGIAEVIGESKRLIDITVALDKIDKIGVDNVKKEMLDKGVSQNSIDKLDPVMKLSGKNETKLDQLTDVLADSEIGNKGIQELRSVLQMLNALKSAGNNLNNDLQIDITLARGLDYYTGAIFEVQAKDVQMGSICGGGRYDDLTGIFGLPGVSGVGISFGADRIYDVLNDLNKFPDFTSATTQVMFVNFGDKEEAYCLPLLAKMRGAGINTEIFPESAKMKKQMKYADSKNIPFVIMVGTKEMESGNFTLKEMSSGDQHELNIDQIIEKIGNKN